MKARENVASIVTRRNFLAGTALGALGIAGAVLAPKVAVASQVSSSNEDCALAQKLWDRAVAEATAAGESIHENIASDPSKITPYAYVTGSAEKWITVALVPTHVAAIAVYETTSTSKIETVYNAWIEVTIGSTSNNTYSWTRLDAGRTLAVNYTCTISNAMGNEVWTFYAEFGASGSGWMS